MSEGIILCFGQKEFKAMVKTIKTVIKSCDEALDGSWDRSDDGFVAMSEELTGVLADIESARGKCGF